jgi:two-component system response regulator AtoC
LSTLQANQWNRKRAARALQISYRSLLYKLKRAGINSRRDASPN